MKKGGDRKAKCRRTQNGKEVDRVSIPKGKAWSGRRGKTGGQSKTDEGAGRITLRVYGGNSKSGQRNKSLTAEKKKGQKPVSYYPKIKGKCRHRQ